MVAFPHSGLCVGPVTPMHENGDINLDVIPEYADHLASNHVNAVFVNGTTGEGLSLTVAERKAVAEAWKVECGDRLKLIIHCGANSVREAQELARHAEALCADAIAALPSFYYRPSSCGDLVKSIAEIASVAPATPFIYYHNPRTHVDLDMAEVLEQASVAIPTFAGIKWADRDAAASFKCLLQHGKNVRLMWANDESVLGALALGINSFNGSSYTYTAPVAHRLIEAFQLGDMKEANRLQSILTRFVHILGKNGEALPRLKAAGQLIGLQFGPARPPLRKLTPEESGELLRELADTGLMHTSFVSP